MFKGIIFGLLMSISANASEIFIDFSGNKVIIEKDGQIFVYNLTSKDLEALVAKDSDTIVNNICEKFGCKTK